jgi:hypothetical protein
VTPALIAGGATEVPNRESWLSDGLPWLNAFIDESGTSDDDLVFSCVAVLVDDAQIDAARLAVEIIAQSLASGGEIKSTSIGDNHTRRIEFLTAIQQIDFQYACLVVDKSAIRDDSGLRFRKSFNKFFKRLLQQPLSAYAAGGVRAVFDQYGWPSTMHPPTPIGVQQSFAQSRSSSS